MAEIRQWLVSIGLEQYADVFEENDLELDLLSALDHEILKDIGITSAGHRLRIIKAAGELSLAKSDLEASLGKRPESTAQISERNEAERRQLTVMFCDLIGSTALSARLDPEELSELVTAFQDHCHRAIKNYQGFIARYMGDGMLVYFGYPRAHEDDAERAVRAALDIVGLMAELNTGISKHHDVELAARVGVATGPVVVGDIVGEGAAEEAAVFGETPNLAARLQDTADTNQVVVASTTRNLLGALFEYEDLGTRELKGIARSVPVWRVVRESDINDRYEAKRLGVRLPLVGRQEELGLLVRSWAAAKQSHGQVVLIQGEAGIGKSRLLEALREHVEVEDYIWAAVRCSPYHTNSTLYPVVEQMKRVVGWKPKDSVEQKIEKLEASLKEQSLPLEEVFPLYAELLLLPLPEGRYKPLDLDAMQRREATLDALVGWLLEMTERAPVLHIWEDLQWVDPTTLELLKLCIEQSPTVSLLNVLTYRPEFVPPWTMHSHMTPITLNRLERPEVEAMIGHQASGKAVPPEVIEHIVAKADGVPLFVEELTKTILESNYICEEADRFTLAGSLSELTIPATLQDSLMARLDRLPTLREIAQLGSVVGREFAYQMLLFLTSHEESVIQSGLEQLVEDELLYQRGRPPRSKYIFKHALIQDAAYQSLLKRTRQQYHQQVAQLLEKRFPETVAEHPELMAHHYTEASMIPQAAEYWKTAGRRAVARSAYLEALSHLDTGLALLEQQPVGIERSKQALEMQATRAGVVLATKGLTAPETEMAYVKARALCEELGNPPAVFSVLRGLFAYHHVRAEYDQAYEAADEYLRLAERQSDSVPRSSAHAQVGGVLFSFGKHRDALGHLEQALDLYDSEAFFRSELVVDQDSKTRALTWLSSTTCLLGYPDQALNLVKQAVRHTEQLGYAYNLAFARSFSNEALNMRREHELARDNAEQLIALAVERGLLQFARLGKGHLGQALIGLGNLDEGIAQLRQAIDANRAVGAAMLQPSRLGSLSTGLMAAGRLGEACESIDEALLLTEQTSERWCEAELLRLKGEVLLKQGGAENTSASEDCFLKSLEIAHEQGAKWWELRTAKSLSRLWRDQSKFDEAFNLLSPIYHWFTEGRDAADLIEAKTYLNELSQHGDK